MQKTQISFYNKYQFACVSFLRVRPKKELLTPYLVLTFGLEHQLSASRIAASTEPYPHRWTHRVILAASADIDNELITWIDEAAAFAATK